MLFIGVVMMVIKKTAEIAEVIRRLEAEYPDAEIALGFSNPLELLVATILSAQCTDGMVNKVTATLFAKYRSVPPYQAG